MPGTNEAVTMGRHIYGGAVALAVILAGGPAAAADLIGGEIGFEYERAFEDGLDDAALETRALIELSRRFGTQIDANLDFLREDGVGIGGALHGFVYAGNFAFGAFAGREGFADDAIGYAGIEAGRDLGTVVVEAYAFGARGAAEGTFAGVKGAQAFGAQSAFGGDIAIGRGDEGSLVRIAATAETRIEGQLRLGGAVGYVSSDIDNADVSAPFVSVGVTMDFGPGQGAAFSRRGLGTLIPGY